MAIQVSNGYIDADGHIRDDDNAIRKYIEAPYDKRPRLSGGNRDGFDNTLGNTLGTRYVDIDVWRQALEQGPLGLTVLYPTGSLASGYISEPDFAVARCKAYNDFLSEEYIKQDDRFQGVGLLPVQDPGEAAKELRRCVEELGMLGGMLPEGPYLLGQAKFDPIYQEADRLGTVLAVHGTGRLVGGIDEFLFPTFSQVHTLGHPYTQMRHFVSIMFEGIPERFPNLRLAFLEAGCGWVPYLLDRMDERYHIRGEVDCPHMSKKPSAYFEDGHIFVSCEAEESLIPEALRILGEDVIVYTSDFPHWDAEYPENLQYLLKRPDLTDEQRTKITRTNAERLYGLTQPARR